MFNEIINELISQEIGQILQEMGIYIFNDPSNTKIKYGTRYENSYFLIKEFFETYKEEIIESRKNGDLSLLLEKVGKKNFKSLNKLFYDFNNYFSEAKYQELILDLNSNRDTQNTRIYFDLIKRRNSILKDMKQHSLNKQFVFKRRFFK